MKWKELSPTAMAIVLRDALDNAEAIYKALCVDFPRRVNAACEKIEVEISILENHETRALAESNDSAKMLLVELFKAYKLALAELSYSTQEPFTAGDVLDQEEVEQEMIELFDKKIDGIYCFPEADRIMLHTPPLPCRGKPKVWLGGRFSNRPVTDIGMYAAAVERAMESNFTRIEPLFPVLSRKTISFLNVFPNAAKAMDNNSRDTANIINAICAHLLNGDTATTTRIVLDGYESDAVPAGTYITVLPTSAALPGGDETVEYWKNKFLEVGYAGFEES